MKKETIVKLGEKGEVQLPLGTLAGIGVKPGDRIEFKIRDDDELEITKLQE